VTYASSNTNAVTVDSSGAATAVGVGTAVITATKAADPNYTQAQASYTINSQSPDTVSAFIGASGAEVILPASANGKQFARARVTDCTPTDTVPTCANAELSPASGASIADTRATLTAPAYYAIVNGSTVGTAIDVRPDRFTYRIGHAVVLFKNRYWQIGGGELIYPSNVTAQNYTLKADVWSSADGKSWKLETADGGFPPRWYHQAVVFNGRIWIISGETPPGATPIWYSDVWSSADGVTWRQETTNAQLPWWGASLNVVVFNNQMLAVSGAQTLTSTTGVFAPLSAPGALTGTPSLGRQFASLTVYNNQLWLIGGRAHYPINQPDIGSATNDVWKSADGITWTQVTANAAFSPRYQHSSFVANGKLWVLGGQGSTAGVRGPPSNDAWSTTDGVTWTQENVNLLANGSLMPVVQETGKVTLFGGLPGIFTNNVWQTTDGANWSELSTNAPFSPRLTTGTEFNGQMWVIGGESLRDSSGKSVRNDIWRSSDGVNWSRATPAGTIFTPRAGHAVVAFNNKLWVIGGGDNVAAAGGASTRMNDVWSSSDGITWTQQTPAGSNIFSPRMGHAAVVFGGKLWVIGGDVATGTTSDTVVNDVWYTADGTTWAQATANAAFPAREGHAVAVLNNSMWLIGGDNGQTGMADLWMSTDGVTWAQQAPVGTPFPARTLHATATLNSRLYVVGGAAASAWGVTQYNDVWSTSDGLNWRQDTAAAAFPGRSQFAMFVHNNELWLTGGFAASLYNDVWRSNDAVSWRVGFSRDIAAP
jgi:N-acetylneuraminic acid mutarotase